jgi:hypothetical protein
VESELRSSKIKYEMKRKRELLISVKHIILNDISGSAVGMNSC